MKKSGIVLILIGLAISFVIYGLIYTSIELSKTEEKLLRTERELNNTIRELNFFKPYQERVEQGIYLEKAYPLLNDYNYTKTIVEKITSIVPTSDDWEIWNRTRDINRWLKSNFHHCKDKKIKVKGTVYDFQFWSPDEILVVEEIHPCGDCDDYAFLFAGMMYASGLTGERVRVECGIVPGGGHCWNGVKVNNTWYKIDASCLWLFPQRGMTHPMAFWPANYWRDVVCYDNYTTTSILTPKGYIEILP